MKTFGRFMLSRLLGRGGMSAVYKAISEGTNQIVAVKILQPRDELLEDLVGRDKLISLFVEEAKLMGAITHPHIARVFDCAFHEGIPFQVMEYYAHSIGTLIGEPHQVEQPSRPVSPATAFLYGIQILDGLSRLHYQDIVHRDIKPYNLMLDSRDQIKIIDFGLSATQGTDVKKIPGMAVGSPYYTAPELEQDASCVDVRSDLYSVGVILFRLLTGELFGAGSAIANVSEYNDALGREWDRFLQQSLSQKPEKRFASALEMRDALGSMYDAWSAEAASVCRMVDSPEPEVIKERPRSQPIRISHIEAQQKLKLDHLFRPGRYWVQDVQEIHAELVLDRTTGLYWQRKGAGFPLSWREAKTYVQKLRKENWQGRNTWRLPTLEELLTILRPPSIEQDFCLDALFSDSLHWVWSGDECTLKSAWYADIVQGFVDRVDKDGLGSVCAVCSGKEGV